MEFIKEDNFDEEESNELYKPVNSRFYILFTFSFYNFISGFLWNAWQPIMRSIHTIYQWNLTQINLLSFIPGIVYCIFIIPFTLLWNKVGIQCTYRLSVCLFLIGTFIRIYPGSIYVQSLVMQIATVITALGGLMALTGAPVISATWFPSNERSRATSTIVSFNTLGSAFAPFVGSIIVPDINLNKSDTRNINSIVEIENGMSKFLYLQASMALICLTLVLIYFPENPEFLPCRSSEKSLRIEYWMGLYSLLRNKQFWIVIVLNFITFGVNSGVGAVFTSFILPLGLSQKKIGLLNMVTTLVTFLAGMVGGWLGDHFKYKTIVIYSVFATIIMYVLSGLQISKYINYGIVSVYILNIVSAFLTNIVCPISFEMGCEAAFPASEEISSAVLGIATNLGICLFIAVTMIPNIGTFWIPYSYAGLIVFLLPLMCFYKGDSKRKVCDNKKFNVNAFYANDISVECPLLTEE